MKREAPDVSWVVHALANACQVLVGLEPSKQRCRACVAIVQVAQDIDAMRLPPPVRDLCRAMMAQTFHRLRARCASSQPEWPRRVDAVLEPGRPLSDAVQQLLPEVPALAAVRPHPFVNRLLNLLRQRHAERGLRLTDIARTVNVSPNTVTRMLREHTGYTYAGVLRENRLRHACELLRGTELCIKEIAWLVGYKHHSQLSRDFARTRGCAPSAYRAACKSAA